MEHARSAHPQPKHSISFFSVMLCRCFDSSPIIGKQGAADCSTITILWFPGLSTFDYRVTAMAWWFIFRADRAIAKLLIELPQSICKQINTLGDIPRDLHPCWVSKDCLTQGRV